MRNKLILSAFVLAAAALLASFTPQLGGRPDTPSSIDPHALTIAGPSLPAGPHPDTF
jgi:hypothetical protein